MSQSEQDPRSFALGLVAAARAAREHAAELRSNPAQIGPEEFEFFADILERQATEFMQSPPKPKLIIPQ